MSYADVRTYVRTDVRSYVRTYVRTMEIIVLDYGKAMQSQQKKKKKKDANHVLIPHMICVPILVQI